jgi:hypothetical protein
MDISKLPNEQLLIASKVIKAAEAVGLDPDFALAIAYNESRFNPKAVSPDGAIGVMQLMPETAKGLKVNPNNVDENIMGGVRYLKEQMDAFGGNKFQASVAYNAGPGKVQEYLKSKDPSVIPNETLKYLAAIDKVYPLDTEAQPEADAEDRDAAALKELEDKMRLSAGQKLPYAFSPEQDVLAGLGGAGIGLGAGTAGSLASGVGRTASAVQQLPAAVRDLAAAQAAAQPAAQAPFAPRYGGEKWVKSLSDVALPGAQMGKADLDLAKQMQAAIGRSGEPGFVGGKITEGGIIINPKTAAEMQAAEASKAAAATAAAQPKPPGALQQMGQAVRSGAGAVMRSPVVSGALGGFGVGANVAEGVERQRRGDPLGVGLSGLGALGSAMSMFPPTAPVGFPLAIGAPAALGLADAYRNRRVADALIPEKPITPEDLEAASRPAFGMYPGAGRRRPAASRPSPEKISGALMQSLDQQMQEFSSSPS